MINNVTTFKLSNESLSSQDNGGAHTHTQNLPCRLVFICSFIFQGICQDQTAEGGRRRIRRSREACWSPGFHLSRAWHMCCSHCMYVCRQADRQTHRKSIAGLYKKTGQRRRRRRVAQVGDLSSPILPLPFVLRVSQSSNFKRRDHCMCMCSITIHRELRV